MNRRTNGLLSAVPAKGGLCLSEAAITGPPLHTHAYRELSAALEEFFEEFGVPIAQPVVG